MGQDRPTETRREQKQFPETLTFPPVVALSCKYTHVQKVLSYKNDGKRMKNGGQNPPLPRAANFSLL